MLLHIWKIYMRERKLYLLDILYQTKKNDNRNNKQLKNQKGNKMKTGIIFLEEGILFRIK